MRYRTNWTYLLALLLLTLPSFALVVEAQTGPTYANTETRVAVEQMVEAHGGLARWRAAPTVSYDNVFFNPFSPTDSWWVDRETTQQSTRRTYQSWPIDGATLAYDGETTWTHGWNRANNPRFMAHFFYYFVNLPWLTQDAGVQLGPAETGSLPGDDTRYITVAMTFAEAPTVGKTAGDSYRLFIHPETHLLQAYEYTIGWGPMLDGMNVPQGELFGPTLRVHDRFSTVDGLTIPATMRTISSDGSQTFGHHAILNPSFSRSFDEARLKMPAGSVVDTETGLRKPATPAPSDPTPFPTLSAAEPTMSGVLEECDLGGPDVGSRCGVFRVPLNHEVDGGPTLDLSFVILTTADSPSAPPVVLLPGGPGDPPTTFAPGLVGRFGSLMADRELLIMDPRGTGRSGSLSCGTGSGPPPLVATPLPEDRVRRCLERWKDQTDLTQYTSKATVYDLEALRGTT